VNSVTENMKNTGQYTISDLHKNIEELLSFTEIFLNSREVNRYLNGDNSQGSELLSESHLIRYLSRFHLSYGEFKQVSLIDEDNQFIFHFDATDPFSAAKLDSDILAHQSVIADQLKDTGSTHLKPTSYLLKTSRDKKLKLIVFRTFSPQHLISDNTFSRSMKFVTSVTVTELDIFQRYEKPNQISFNQELRIDVKPLARIMEISNEFTQNEFKIESSTISTNIKSKLVQLTLSLPETYLDDLLIPYRNAIISLVFNVSIFTFFILKLLIQKQIISPVIKLTKQIENTRRGINLELNTINRKDEIALLNNNYVLLFEELNKMAKTDSLTGLSNRVLFNAALRKTINQSVLNHTKSALLYIDLDNFKYVNDNYGHHVGDNLLIAFSQKLNSIFEHEHEHEHEHDIGLGTSRYEIARLAGDEFAILISNISNRETIALIAQRITELGISDFQVQEQNFEIKVSIGISICPDDSDDAEQLIKNADLAMYQVKKYGKNGYQFYSKDLDDQVNKSLKIETKLKKALYENDFYLMWMPIYDCRNGKVMGAEALLRTNALGSRNFGPTEFIPIAETSDLIKEIDYWVIESVIAKLKELLDEFDFDGVLAVNFSAWELKNIDFAKDVAQLIKKYDVPADQLEFEITETCLIADDSNASRILKELKDLGVRLSLDDFGTGYTAFNQLANYPVDTLKVDKTFIDAIGDASKKDKLLIDIIVELAALYSLDVIAEGVETKEQLDYVKKVGCNGVQGFYLSKPISWLEFVKIIPQKRV
jgi:diguanylate cyclase (GGDEF)-like protein